MIRTKFNKDIICWWSGGVASAVACHNEHEDTYRFKDDCEKWGRENYFTYQVFRFEFEHIMFKSKP